MGRRSPNAGIGGRTQQAGTLVAATVMPLTFQPTLMPRSPLDQALVTGISTALNYSFAALVQDSIEALALRGAGVSCVVARSFARIFFFACFDQTLNGVMAQCLKETIAQSLIAQLLNDN